MDRVKTHAKKAFGELARARRRGIYGKMVRDERKWKGLAVFYKEPGIKARACAPDRKCERET